MLACDLKLGSLRDESCIELFLLTPEGLALFGELLVILCERLVLLGGDEDFEDGGMVGHYVRFL